MTPIEHLFAVLRNHGFEPKPSGKGWTCRCPAHDDRSPSLSIAVGDGGRALVRCHAGCATKDVVGTLGLELRDLMPDNLSGQRTQTNPGGLIYATAQAAVEELEERHGPLSEYWTYTDATGSPVGMVVRWNRGSGKKIIRPVSKRGDGWAIGGMAAPRPLYQMPAIAGANRIYITEGEPAADAAISCGLVATTSPHGSKSAAKTDWSPVAGHDVVILPDRDDAGEQYADKVVSLARKAGARSVRVVRLSDCWPDLPSGGDLVDVLELTGGDADAVRAAVEELINAAENEKSAVVNEPLPAFDADAMFPPGTEFVSDYFRALACSTQTPIEMSALLGLAIASACIANVAQIRGHGDHIEPAQIWALVLSEPGTRKTAVLSDLLRPVLAWEKAQDEAMKPVIADEGQRRKITEKRIKRLEDKAAKESDSSKCAAAVDEAVALAQELDSNPVPTRPVLLASEPTPEALTQQMAENSGRALLASAEGDAFDIIQGRYSGSRNYGAMLKGHAGDSIRAQRVGRPGDVIDRPALAAALCIQRAAVEAIWADPQAEGRGLLARFAICSPPDLVGSRDVRPTPMKCATREDWQAGITRLLEFEPVDDPVTINLSSEADALYYELQLQTETALGFGDLADRRAWGGKLCGLALRIALTLHALSTWAQRGAPDDGCSISGPTMASAIAWVNYLAAAERHARAQIRETDQDRQRARLIRWIEGKGGSVTARDLTKGLRAFKGKSDNARAALNDLVESGFGTWVTPAPGKSGGRPTRRFVLATCVPVPETPAERGGNKGIGDGDSGDTTEKADPTDCEARNLEPADEALAKLLIDAGVCGIELSTGGNDGTRILHTPDEIANELAGRIQIHERQLLRLLRGVGIPDDTDPGNEASYIMCERLGIADELGMPIHIGSSAWLIAAGEALQNRCHLATKGV